MTKFDEDQVRHLELVAKALEKGQSFNAIFIAAGYATFFALWKNVEGCATPASHMVAGASITLSVVLYVAWMVTGLVALNFAMMSLVKQVESSPRPQSPPQPTNFQAASAYLRGMLNDKDSDMTQAQRVTYRVLLLTLDIGKMWPFALAAIMLPALVGIAIVFFTYVHGVWLGYHGEVLHCVVRSAG